MHACRVMMFPNAGRTGAPQELHFHATGKIRHLPTPPQDSCAYRTGASRSRRERRKEHTTTWLPRLFWEGVHDVSEEDPRFCRRRSRLTA